jgi:hypothetical protein
MTSEGTVSKEFHEILRVDALLAGSTDVERRRSDVKKQLTGVPIEKGDDFHAEACFAIRPICNLPCSLRTGREF